MSQSDYIKHKKITNELKYQKVLPKVLTSHFYTRCVQYAIESEIIKEDIIFGPIAPIKKENGCPIFIMCSNTENRPNRQNKYKTMRMVSYFPSYVKDNKPKICCL
jgi:hypothetical protein